MTHPDNPHTPGQDIQDAINNRLIKRFCKDAVLYTMPDGKTIICTGESITGIGEKE